MKTIEATTKNRPPVVVVVGHIDHGKTTLLDAIRQTKVAEKESGGITQHIGAYRIEHKGRAITFIDTPGHEAFSKMRSRGAAAADIGILVVAADDGVKPQTKEAIKILEEAHIPFLVAINKIDKPNANADKIKQELAEQNVLVESWGGKIPAVEISAKQGTNLDDLLELVLLMADVENLTTHEGPGEAIVIESHRDPGRGNTATLLVLDGVVKKGDVLAFEKSVESTKIFENFLGKPVMCAEASAPLLVAGLSLLPDVGQIVRAFHSKKEAEEYLKSRAAETTHKPVKTPSEPEKPTLFLILKTDVSGSKEAIEGMLETLQYPEVGIVLLKSEVGDVNEGDIKTASVAAHSVIAAFKVKVSRAIKDLAERSGCTIIESDIIYDLLDVLKEELSRLMPAEIVRTDTGRAKILALFKKQEDRQVIGGRVISGVLSRGSLCEIQRESAIVERGKIRELQHLKQSVSEVKEGLEFGALLENVTPEIKVGDTLIAYKEEKRYKKL